MKKATLALLGLIVFILSSCQNKTDDKQYLIMLSLDGFRWNYPAYMNTPTLDSLQKAGVKAQSLKASFPTKTFPNHYTIATGLYPDNHGIVLNSFYADDLGKRTAFLTRNLLLMIVFMAASRSGLQQKNKDLSQLRFFGLALRHPQMELCQLTGNPTITTCPIPTGLTQF